MHSLFTLYASSFLLFAINQLGVSGKNGIVIATRMGIAPHIMQATRQVVTAPTT